MVCYQGSEIIQFTAELAKISNIVYKEYPYLYDVEDDAQFYLTKYCQSEDAKLLLAYEKDKVIGYVIGLPLKDYSLTFQRPFTHQGLEVEDFFYIGELAILPEYRRQGAGTELMIQMEEWVKQDQKYPKICLLHIDEEQICSKKPKETIKLALFWTYLGYTQQPTLSFSLDWKNVGEITETAHTLIYWTKPLLKENF